MFDRKELVFHSRYLDVLSMSNFVPRFPEHGGPQVTSIDVLADAGSARSCGYHVCQGVPNSIAEKSSLQLPSYQGPLCMLFFNGRSKRKDDGRKGLGTLAHIIKYNCTFNNDAVFWRRNGL